MSKTPWKNKTFSLETRKIKEKRQCQSNGPGDEGVKGCVPYKGLHRINHLIPLETNITFNVMSSEQEASNIPEGSHLIALTSFCKRTQHFTKKLEPLCRKAGIHQGQQHAASAAVQRDFQEFTEYQRPQHKITPTWLFFPQFAFHSWKNTDIYYKRRAILIVIFL